MKRKLLLIILTLILSLCSLFGLTACDGKKDATSHTHNFATLKYNAENHWYECTCGVYETKENHNPGAEATETTDQKCTECDYVITPALGHVHTLHLTKVDEKSQSCTEEGNIEYYTCSCGKWFADNTATTEITDKDSVIIEKDDHNYNTLKNNEIEHWYECTCGAYETKENHNPGAEATETTDQKCTECDYVITPACGDIIGTDGLQYILINDDTEYAVSKYAGTSIEVYIPAIYNNLPVTSIGEGAFFNCDALERIEIPNSVTSIGDSAFYDCEALTSVEIPNGVTSIGEWAFSNCDALERIEIPNGVTSIGEWAFCGCVLLTSVTIPDSVTSIGEYAFSDCFLLTSVSIGNSVTSIGVSVFHGCDSLTSVEIPNSVTSIGDSAFCGCDSLRSVSIGNSVTSIGDFAFSNCDSLTSVEIPNGVTSIGYSAFSYCESLTSIIIPNSVTSIGEYAFSDCFLLTSVSIGNGVTSIGEWAFYNCTSLESVVIPNSVTSIGKRAFYGCDSLTSVTIGNSVTSIGDAAFSDCDSLTSVEIPNSVTSIGEDAFYHCDSLTSVTIGNGVTSIGEDAFNGCYSLQHNIENNLKYLGNDTNKYLYLADTTSTSVTSASINANCRFIGDYAFFGCYSLESVVIPNSVTSIGEYAFRGCCSLTSVSIGNSVTSIGDAAFAGCDLLINVYYNGTEEEWENISIDSNNTKVKNAIRYYYIENQEDVPTDGGNYWHYDENGNIAVWV